MIEKCPLGRWEYFNYLKAAWEEYLVGSLLLLLLFLTLKYSVRGHADDIELYSRVIYCRAFYD